MLKVSMLIEVTFNGTEVDCMGPRWKFYRLGIDFLDLDDILMGSGVDFMNQEWTLPGLNEYFTDLDCAFTDPEC